MKKILLLSPGEMGAAVGGELVKAGHIVLWHPEGRSKASQARAADAGLTEATVFVDSVAEVDFVMSICPPADAATVAAQVAAAGRPKHFVDCNAISTGTLREIATQFETFTDGGIIGSPPSEKSSPRLYLSGPHAAQLTPLFEGTYVDARVCGENIGAASALKMAFAAYSKGSAALILGIRALAEHHGITDSLESEWEQTAPALVSGKDYTAYSTSRKAWRFVYEMREIAASFRDADLPDGFHEAAAEVYDRMAEFKNNPAEMDEVLRAILTNHPPKE